MFENLFTIDSLITFLILTALETVLGFDNLLYISIESKKVDPAREASVRRTGIMLAIGLRIVLLFVVLQLIASFQAPLWEVQTAIFGASVSGHSLIVLFGGIFLIYTAIKEIYHMIGSSDLEHGADAAPRRTVAAALTWILIMNIVFSFDTVLSAVALTKNFVVMTAAIVVSGVLMVVMADSVANFLKKNRMYEVLGLFVLLLVGYMLLSEGGHLAQLSFFGFAVEPMAKSTFYFVLVTLVIVEIIQSRYQKRILDEQDRDKH
ncbi:MAG: Membrane protein TerC, involved in tellurium resistance [Rhizobium sp.]|nr:Membrane protein TerC, involved in tellurium resistance [Rhizobium sp.]